MTMVEKGYSVVERLTLGASIAFWGFGVDPDRLAGTAADG